MVQQQQQRLGIIKWYVALLLIQNTSKKKNGENTLGPSPGTNFIA